LTPQPTSPLTGGGLDSGASPPATQARVGGRKSASLDELADSASMAAKDPRATTDLLAATHREPSWDRGAVVGWCLGVSSTGTDGGGPAVRTTFADDSKATDWGPTKAEVLDG
jgi:hypothetical protein